MAPSSRYIWNFCGVVAARSAGMTAIVPTSSITIGTATRAMGIARRERSTRSGLAATVARAARAAEAGADAPPARFQDSSSAAADSGIGNESASPRPRDALGRAKRPTAASRPTAVRDADASLSPGAVRAPARGAGKSRSTARPSLRIHTRSSARTGSDPSFSPTSSSVARSSSQAFTSGHDCGAPVRSASALPSGASNASQFSLADRRPASQCRRPTRPTSRRASETGGVPLGAARIHTRRRNTASKPINSRPPSISRTSPGPP